MSLANSPSESSSTDLLERVALLRTRSNGDRLSFPSKIWRRCVEVIQPILAVVQEEDGTCFVASFVDANINASGETQLEAVEMLKDMISSSFQLFLTREAVLGDEPKRQLAVLRHFVRIPIR